MTAMYTKWLERFQRACNSFAWTVKSMDTNRKGEIDVYIEQVNHMERTLREIKRALIFFKNTKQDDGTGPGLD